MEPIETVDDILEHVGIKGMKWGVRKESEAQNSLRVGNTKKAFKDSRKDARFLKKTHGANLNVGRMYGKTTNSIIKDATKAMKPEIKVLNSKPEYSTKNAKSAIKKAKYDLHPTNPLVAKYHKEQSAIYMKHIKASSSKHLKVSPSGKWKDELKVGKNYWQVSLVRTDSAKHANISEPDLVFLVRPIFDDEGYIVDYEMMDESMAQSDYTVDDILEHVGIKGMHWGVRKASSGPQSVVVKDKRKKIKTSGGQGYPAHPDALRAHRLGQIGKKSGLKSLSNKELQDYSTRMNLEQNVKRLGDTQKSPGGQYAKTLLKESGKGAVSGVANEAAKQGVRKGGGALIKLSSPHIRNVGAVGASAVAFAFGKRGR